MREETMIPSLESLRQLAFRAIVGTDERIPETQDGVCEEMPEQTAETPKMIVVESPLSGDTVRNRRFAAWCCRAVWEVERVVAIASHLICPQYLDDRVPEERAAGMGLKVCWGGDAHESFDDFGVSDGMDRAMYRCFEERIPWSYSMLEEYHPPSWEAFQRGEWPPCTPGFGPSELDQLAAGMNETDQAILLEIARTLKDGKINNEYLSGSVYVALQAARNKARAKNDKRAPRVPRKHGECLAAVLSAVDSEPRSAAELAKRCGLTRKATYATLERLVEKEKVLVTQGRWPKYWRTV